MYGNRVSMDSEELLCNTILKTNNKIRFVGMVTYKGKPVAWQEREGVTPLVGGKEREILLTEAGLIVRMNQEFDESLGKVNFVFARRGKVDLLGFPMENYFLYLTLDRGIDFDGIEKINQKLRETIT